MPSALRARLPYLALVAATIGVGLAVHGDRHLLSAAARDVAGDALWAAMVWWGTGLLAPATGRGTRALASVLFCFAVELSQLHHSPGLDALRRTTFGVLVLGSGFDRRDLGAYVLGVTLAALLELAALAARRRRGRPGSQGSA